ncbi:MAG: radical SAM protein [Turicibacter sp.]|nr:radical SAM protein [Turicibacter sp.]
MKKSNDIGFFVVIVGQKCSLRCKDCCNFAPFAPPENMSYNVNDLTRQLRAVTEVFSIRKLLISGGEPFIYPHLDKIIKSCLDNDKIAKINIATNGIQFPTVDLELLRNEKLEIRLSSYPIVEQRASELNDFLTMNGIKTYFHKFASKISLWHKLGGVDCEASDRNPSEIFEKCDKNICYTLDDGKIAYCSRAINASYVQKFTPNERDYITVDDKDFADKFKKYIQEPKYMEACRYCYGYDIPTFVEPAVQIK